MRSTRGARRIEVELERGGCGLIRVRDDGSRHRSGGNRAGTGAACDQQDRLARRISRASPPWGFAARHCPASPRYRDCRWSRARRRPPTPGRSRPATARSAAPAPASHPPGTSVEVRDLFFNVPARRKFLRSREHRISAHRAHAGASGAVALRRGLYAGAQRQDDLDAAGGAQRRASAWRGWRRSAARSSPATSSNCSHDTESLRLSGWLALPTFSRSQADLQFAFLNGRFVRDKLLAGAARLAYQDVLFHGRFSRLLAVSGAGSDPGRRQRASAKAGGAISRFAPHP